MNTNKISESELLTLLKNFNLNSDGKEKSSWDFETLLAEVNKVNDTLKKEQAEEIARHVQAVAFNNDPLKALPSQSAESKLLEAILTKHFREKFVYPNSSKKIFQSAKKKRRQARKIKKALQYQEKLSMKNTSQRSRKRKKGQFRGSKNKK